ncbi:MAG: hypothetical protein PHH09_04040 [Methanoregulaceae archaeon]|nr:hypothetical protein [Methanoregulaceae archaeon]
MKLAEALAIKARELGMHNMAVLPKLSEEERVERNRECSRRYRNQNREKVHEYHRRYYYTRKEDRHAGSLPEFTGFYLTTCPACGHTKPTAAATPTMCPQCGRRFDPVKCRVEKSPEEARG